ncbi:MAG: ABC transporter ATP-binding protein [Clostridia bacterium]|nr:ABC transporter ATP-binding protein [Clostridia bacterium]
MRKFTTHSTKEVILMSNAAVIRKLLKYLKGSRRYLFLSLIMAFITTVLTLLVPILTGVAVDNMLGENAVNMHGVVKIIIVIAIATVVTAFVQWVMNIINNRVTYTVVRRVRDEAFNKIQSLPLSYIDSRRTGDIVNRVISDVDQFAEGLLLGLSQSFSSVLTIIGTLAFMLYIDWKIALLVLFVTPLSFVVAAFIAKKTYSMFKLRSETQAEATAYIDEMIAGKNVVAAFGKEKEVSEHFDEINTRLDAATLDAVFYSSITNPATRFVNSLVYALVGLAGALLATSGGITVGALSSFLSYANQYTKPFNEISGVVTELQNAIICAGRVLEVIEEESEKADCENCEAVGNDRGDVKLTNVYFSYDKAKKLIEELNLDVKKGQRVAIVGPTGCGKTTLINLLMRFYDVDNGEICLENKNIESLTRQNLREGFGMVLQETWLKSGTVKENIAFGKPDATDEEIIEAAKKAHAHGFIKRLPKGYDTVISDNSALSQGQKQLLCIARLMLVKPPMLILDEATSSIDTRTEIRIQKAFATLMEGRTSFIVAHRLSTIREADVILVMRDGKIIEQGNHKALMEKGGFYKELYNAGLNKD